MNKLIKFNSNNQSNLTKSKYKKNLEKHFNLLFKCKFIFILGDIYIENNLTSLYKKFIIIN